MASSVKVKSGDTLSQIAKSKGVTLQALLAANPDIKNANMIRVGQTIKMPKANSVPGNTKGSPYGRMSQTQMNMLKGTKDQQRAVTSALRSEVSRSGAQTTPTPKKEKEILNAPFNKLRERVLKNKPTKKPSSNSGSMSGLRDDDVAAKKGGIMRGDHSGKELKAKQNRTKTLLGSIDEVMNPGGRENQKKRFGGARNVPALSEIAQGTYNYAKKKLANPSKKVSGSMSGLKEGDVAAKKGGYMKKYKSGGKTSSEENRLTKLGRAKKPRSQQGNSMANDVTTSLGRTRADMEAVARGGVKAKNKGGIMRGAGAATRGKKFGRCS